MNYLHNYAVMPEFWIKHRLRKATVKLLNIDACSVTNERRPLTFWFLILRGVDNTTVSVCHSFLFFFYFDNLKLSCALELRLSRELVTRPSYVSHTGAELLTRFELTQFEMVPLSLPSLYC